MNFELPACLDAFGSQRYVELVRLVLCKNLPLSLVGHIKDETDCLEPYWSEAIGCIKRCVAEQGSLFASESVGDHGRAVLAMVKSGCQNDLSTELLIAAVQYSLDSPSLDCWPQSWKSVGIRHFAPELASLVDKEGLILINDPKVCVDKDGFLSSDYRIPFHPKLSRNRELVAQLLNEYDRNKETKIRLAPDYLRSIHVKDFKQLMQLDHARGKPYSRSDLNDPYSVGLTVHTAPYDMSLDQTVYVQCAIQQLIRTEFLWSRKGSLKEFQMEEITKRTGWRFMHALYDLDERCFKHIDGAWMHYSPTKANNRRSQVGGFKKPKADFKPKLFRVDGSFSESLFSTCMTYFFRNNPLVWEYLDGHTGPSVQTLEDTELP